MGALIDASVLIAYERGQLRLDEQLVGRETEEFFLSVITASELLHGVHHAQSAGVRARRAAFVEAVLERFPMLSVDLVTARVHAQLWADLAAAGTMIGPHDLWLAAACVAHDLRLVTSNVREFARVAGLTVDSWPAEP